MRCAVSQLRDARSVRVGMRSIRQQGFQSLERQFDLPAQAIDGEHFLGRIAFRRQRGSQDHEFRLQSGCADRAPFCLREASARNLLRAASVVLRGLAPDDQAQRQRRVQHANSGAQHHFVRRHVGR